MDANSTSQQKPMIVRYVVHQQSGIQAHNIRRHAIGYVMKGRKYIHDGDLRYEVRVGEAFYLGIGNHYTENIPENGKPFEEIMFYYEPEQLSRVISILSISYGMHITNDHMCDNCREANYLIFPEWAAMKSFFKTTCQYLSDDTLRENRTAEMLKLTELIYMIVSREDCCLKNKILSDLDTVKENFEQIVHKSIFSDASIEELANKCNRSITSFKKDFKKHFGESPHKWFIRQRLTYARLQLISSGKSIAEIGNECNFPNTSHFIKLFRKEFGETPAIYRKLYSGAEPGQVETTIAEYR